MPTNPLLAHSVICQMVFPGVRRKSAHERRLVNKQLERIDRERMGRKYKGHRGRDGLGTASSRSALVSKAD